MPACWKESRVRRSTEQHPRAGARARGGVGRCAAAGGDDRGAAATGTAWRRTASDSRRSASAGSSSRSRRTRRPRRRARSRCASRRRPPSSAPVGIGSTEVGSRALELLAPRPTRRVLDVGCRPCILAIARRSRRSPGAGEADVDPRRRRRRPDHAGLSGGGLRPCVVADGYRSPVIDRRAALRSWCSARTLARPPTAPGVVTGAGRAGRRRRAGRPLRPTATTARARHREDGVSGWCGRSTEQGWADAVSGRRASTPATSGVP